MRVLIVCCVLLGVCLAVLAAPLPKSKTNFVGGQGPPHDPTKSCKFTSGDGSLTVETTGKKVLALDLRAETLDREGVRKPEAVTAPYLVRPVMGDFVVQVRVRGDFVATRSGKQTLAEVSAGLLYIEERAQPTRAYRIVLGAKDDGKRQPFALAFKSEAGSESAYRWMEKDAVIKACVSGPKQMTAYLKIERMRWRLYGYVSADGKKWAPITPIPDGDVIHPKLRARVGVAVFSSSTSPLKVTFDQFSVTQLKD